MYRSLELFISILKASTGEAFEFSVGLQFVVMLANKNELLGGLLEVLLVRK